MTHTRPLDLCRWRRDRERIADFIGKKREIFLVQMSLDTKRAEIRKLEERLLQREDALKKSEQMLEDDAVQFDQFLRENETKVNEAIKKADAEAKKRADKVRLCPLGLVAVVVGIRGCCGLDLRLDLDKTTQAHMGWEHSCCRYTRASPYLKRYLLEASVLASRSMPDHLSSAGAAVSRGACWRPPSPVHCTVSCNVQRAEGESARSKWKSSDSTAASPPSGRSSTSTRSSCKTAIATAAS